MKKIVRWMITLLCVIAIGCAGALASGTTVTYAHSFTNVTRIEPTCTQAGKIIYECVYCGESYEETIPALGHDYRESARADATTQHAGSITYTCTRCGASYEVAIPQLQSESGSATESAPAVLPESSAYQADSVPVTEAAQSAETPVVAEAAAEGTQTVEPAQSAETPIIASIHADVTQEAEPMPVAEMPNVSQTEDEPVLAGEQQDVVDTAATVVTGEKNEVTAGGMNAISATLLVSIFGVCAVGLLYFLSYLPLLKWARQERAKAWRKNIWRC